MVTSLPETWPSRTGTLRAVSVSRITWSWTRALPPVRRWNSRRVAGLHRPESRLQVLTALLQPEAGQLKLRRPGRRVQHQDPLGTAELNHPHVGRQFLPQQVGNERAARVLLARSDDCVVCSVDGQDQQSSGLDTARDSAAARTRAMKARE